MKPRLETIANVATIAASMLVITMVVSRFLAPHATPSEPYQPGDVLPSIPGLQYSEVDRTVLLFVRSTCPYCTISMPFYKTLLDNRYSVGQPTYRVVALSYEPEDAITAYFAAHNLAVDDSLSIAPGATAVTKTPTLLLVDTIGRVLGSWSGLLTAEREAEVRQTIATS